LYPIFFDNKNSAVLLIGGSKSGKNYTLRGNENKEKGIIINTLEDIFNLIEI